MSPKSGTWLRLQMREKKALLSSSEVLENGVVWSRCECPDHMGSVLGRLGAASWKALKCSGPMGSAVSLGCRRCSWLHEAFKQDSSCSSQ